MIRFPQKINKKLEGRRENSALRSLKNPSHAIDFSSNDYLGFSRSKTIFQQVESLLRERNITQNGSTGSRLLTGNHALYTEAETQIAKFHQTEAALIFNSGYDANIGILSSVPQRGDVILYDEYIHASIRDGIQLSNAKAYKYQHNNLSDLENKLNKFQQENTAIYIVTESVFSMDGDSPDLTKLVQMANEYSAFLIIDEAHATGVFGEKGVGLIQQLNLENDLFARIHTFGKGLGCHGAVILGSQKLKEFLLNFSRSFIYTTALPPHSLANIIVAYQTLETTEEITVLTEKIDFFKNKVITHRLDSRFISSNSPIQCCVIKGNKRVKNISQKLLQAGFNIKPILSPTVPKDKERLRFCIHSYTTYEEIDAALKLLAHLLENE